MPVKEICTSLPIFLLIAAAVMGQDESHVASEAVYLKLQNVLLTDQKSRYMIQEVFFPSQDFSADWLYLNVCVIVIRGQPGGCGDFGGQSNFSHCQKFQWSSSALANLISIDQLLILDNVISESIVRITQHRKFLHFPLHIDSLPCNATEDDILTALLQLLPWVKSYARVHGPTNEKDRGYVSISYNEYVTGSYKSPRLSITAHIYRLFVLGAFIFINLLAPVALSKSASLYYPKIRTKLSPMQEVKEFMYIATAIMAFLCNALYTAYSIRHHIFRNKPAITSCIIANNHECTIPFDKDVYSDELVSMVAVIVIIPFAVFIELLISIYTVKCNSMDQSILKYSQFWKQLLFQMSDVFILWNVFIMFQLFAKVAIPICVLLLIHPQVTICWFLVLLMIIVTVSLTVTYLLYHCQQLRKRKACYCNARHCGRKFLHFIVMFAILGLILVLLALYELLLIVQVQFEIGVKGIILSLLPSFPLSVFGWYIKRRSQMKANEDSLQPLTETQETRITDTSIDEEPLPL